MRTLVCPICGKSFETHHALAICCGPKCAAIRMKQVKAERKRNGGHRMCTMCGARFFTTVLDRETCTACTSALKKKNRAKEAKYTYKEIAAKNRANPIQSGWRGQMRIAARPALKKFE